MTGRVGQRIGVNMDETEIDSQVQFVIDNLQTIVGSEGGSLELVDLRGGHLTVRYVEGRNDECPECVPTHEMVSQIMKTSLAMHAPYVTGLELL